MGIESTVETDVEDAVQDVENVFKSAPASVKALATKFEGDAEQAFQTDAKIAAQDIFNSGDILLSAPYIQAAKDIWAKVPDESALLFNDIFAMINAEVSYLIGQNPDSSQAQAAAAA
jgi:uncharacterized protein YukE